MNKMDDRTIDGILTHFKHTYRHPFPRQLGFPKQKKVYNEEELITIVNSKINNSNCYGSVFSDYQQTNSIFDKLFVDIDSETNMKLATTEMKKLYTFHKEYFNHELRIYFSANKGYAIYFDFPKIEITYEKVWRYIDNLSLMLNLKCVDLKVSKDYRRISRMPYTTNFNNVLKGREPKLCVPIDPNWSYNQILKESKDCKYKHPIVIEPCLEVQKIIERIKVPKSQIIGSYAIQNASETLQKLLQYAHLFNDGRHRVLYQVIIPLLIRDNSSITMDEIHAYCKQFIEASGKQYILYRSHVTYHIYRNKGHPYKPYSMDEFFMEYPDVLESIIEENKKVLS